MTGRSGSSLAEMSFAPSREQRGTVEPAGTERRPFRLPD